MLVTRQKVVWENIGWYILLIKLCGRAINPNSMNTTCTSCTYWTSTSTVSMGLYVYSDSVNCKSRVLYLETTCTVVTFTIGKVAFAYSKWSNKLTIAIP